MDDLKTRLRHYSENTRDEYLHELTGRAADRIEALEVEVARLKVVIHALRFPGEPLGEQGASALMAAVHEYFKETGHA